MSYHSIAVLVIALCVTSCTHDAGPTDGDASSTRDAKSEDDRGQGDAGGGDARHADADVAPTCQTLYGDPVEQTGLSEDECQPTCTECEGGDAPRFDTEDLSILRSLQLVDPPAELDSDPYDAMPSPQPRPDAACGVVREDANSYRLETFDDPAAAAAAGAVVTHHGACGTCSTLQDLATYVDVHDLTAPVRECGLQGIRDGEQANIDCLTDLGFTLPCAQTWYYNTRNTRNECLELCLPAINDPYHLEDGSINPCLQCDEDKSGAVFKAVAGRTRRNSGLASAICRPCDSVRPVAHDY